MGVDGRLRAVVELAQAMAAACAPRDSVRAAARGARVALDGSFAAISAWERERGRLRVLVNEGERRAGEEEFPEDESYPVHDFPEITEFLHELWVGGGGPHAWVESAVGDRPGRRGDALRRRGRGTCVVAPIVLSGRAWGELYVARDEDCPTSTRTTPTSPPCSPPWSRPVSRRTSGWRRPGGSPSPTR